MRRPVLSDSSRLPTPHRVLPTRFLSVRAIMRHHFPSKVQLRGPLAELGEEDGLDPRRRLGGPVVAGGAACPGPVRGSASGRRADRLTARPASFAGRWRSRSTRSSPIAATPCCGTSTSWTSPRSPTPPGSWWRSRPLTARPSESTGLTSSWNTSSMPADISAARSPRPSRANVRRYWSIGSPTPRWRRSNRDREIHDPHENRRKVGRGPLGLESDLRRRAILALSHGVFFACFVDFIDSPTHELIRQFGGFTAAPAQPTQHHAARGGDPCPGVRPDPGAVPGGAAA